jgi:hypothetical protein
VASARVGSNGRKPERSTPGGTRYVLSNLNLKKGLKYGLDSQKEISSPGDQQAQKKLAELGEKGTYKGLIKVKNTDPGVQGDY